MESAQKNDMEQVSISQKKKIISSFIVIFKIYLFKILWKNTTRYTPSLGEMVLEYIARAAEERQSAATADVGVRSNNFNFRNKAQSNAINESRVMISIFISFRFMDFP